MTVTVRVGEQDAERLEFGVSALAELVAALHVLAEPGHHGGLLAWAERVRAELPAGLAAEYEALSFLWRSYRASFLVPPVHGTTADLAAELDELDALPPRRFAEEAVQPLRGGGPRSRTAGVLDDEAVRARVRTYARARGASVARVVEELLADPPAVRMRLRRFLEGCWSCFFAAEWTRLRPLLVADAQEKSGLVRVRGVYGALAALGPGVTARPDDGVVVVDKLHHGRIDVRTTTLHLAPSALGWPHILVQDDPAWPACVQYPLPGARPFGAAPALREVERRLAALADPVRLRLCRSLAREARSTQELADTYGMPAPQVSRHLRLLRDAGLVRRERQGHFMLYRLDTEATSRLGQHLLDALLR